MLMMSTMVVGVVESLVMNTDITVAVSALRRNMDGC